MNCNFCGKEFKHKSNKYAHHRICPYKPVEKLTPVIVNKELDELKSGIAAIQNQISVLADAVTNIKSAGTTNNITNITQTNNISIFFNEDLKYYPELVKIMGKDKAGDYLLFKMPESKDLFNVLDLLFVKDGISSCPIQLDGTDFVVTRSKTEFVTDPTGELIVKENKSKLQDAVLSAYIESTKTITSECEKLRLKRVNGEYNEEDQEVLNRRFESMIEPSRPYDVINIINRIKPGKKDFDRLRKICSTVTKK